MIKERLRKARHYYRMGLFKKSLQTYNSILEDELSSSVQNYNIGPVFGTFSRIENELSFFEKNLFFNFYLKLSNLFVKNSELNSAFKKFQSNIKDVHTNLQIKAKRKIQPNRPDLSNVTLIIIDCVDFERAKLSYMHCINSLKFAEAKILTHEKREEPYVENILPIKSSIAYSTFCIKELANYFDTEFVMIAQWDGFVWNTNLWKPEFLEYDYIGAPWGGIVGNGGFSIRSKKLQDFLRDDINLPDVDIPEDSYISKDNRPYLESNGFTYAPLDLAEEFSIENGTYRKAFGVHNRLLLV